MKIQQIRNAMVRIRYAGKTFLTDPWLAPRGSMGTFRDYPMFRCRPERLDLPLPLCDLPMPVADILTGVDAYIVTHVHPDHIDMAADGSVGAPLDKAVPVFVQSEEDAAVLRRSGFARVDLFLTPDQKIVFNEVNTIPGFTSHSRYPNMMKGIGLTFPEMLAKLLDLSLEKSYE